jgi:hypothetical protein
VDPRLTGYARRPDAAYLFPLHRSQNPNSKGVIHVTGTVGVSGVVRGRLTLHATGTIVILDDLRYASDPGSNNCNDMLGLIAGANVTVADNAVLTPPDIALGSGTVYRNVDDTKDLYLHAVVMALGTSFGVEDYNTGPTSANDCETSQAGRGCLYLTGGIIQERRGAVGQLSSPGLTGFLKRYSYDRCVLQIPPPYFPTTGRFKESQHLEVDPTNFDIAAYFNALTPP